MATYYVGLGGNDGNTGLSWAQRFLTLNGAEDEPVAAADTVYVAPGIYREMLTCDVSGAGGSPITYIGDVTGEHTDGIGGIVRITGSDNDITAARASCIVDVTRDYRTFRGFCMDITSAQIINGNTAGANWIIEDCSLVQDINANCIYVNGVNQDSWTIRRSILINSHFANGIGVLFNHSGTLDDIGHVVENCVISGAYGVTVQRIGGVTIRNCFIHGARTYGVNLNQALAAGQTLTVNNCIMMSCSTAFRAIADDGTFVEDYNTLSGCNTSRTNVDVGGNSLTYPPLFNMPVLHAGASQISGYQFPWWFGELSEWSQIAAITGSSEPAVDLQGIPRPATASKNSWGPHQFQNMEVESTTVQAGSYARTLLDAGDVLVRRVPHDNTEITVTLYMRYGNTHAGNLPQMIIKQPGQADSTDTMVAAADNWEQLSITFTPAALPGFFEVWAKSRNTAAIAATTRVIYDTLDVS